MNACGMMECNRDEALKAREIAEMRFAAKDVIGAKKFAIKAQNLWPDLDGIGQMLATLNVLLSAEAIINGERDWYAILSINSLAEDEIVKKQYRKLALMLHPDKNKSVGAESAFKLISEAWNVLSDKTRRRIYDQKRTQVAQPKFSQLHGSYGFYHFANGAASTFRNHKNTARRSMGSSTKMPCSAPSPKRNTFWTSCNHCKMQYEYFRIYLNQNLFCSNCQESFLATEITRPASGSKLPALWATQSSFHNRDTSNQGRNSFSRGTGSTKFHNITNLEYFNSSKFHWGAFSRTAGAASAVASSSAAALAATVVHQTYEKVKREREEKQAAARRAASLQKNHASKRTANSTSKGTCGIFNGCISDRNQSILSNNDMPFKKKRNINSDAIYNYEIERIERSKSTSTSLDSHTFTIGTNDGDCRVFGLGWGTLHKRRSFSWESSPLEIQKVLVQKAKKLVLKKLDECNSVEATMQKDTASANKMIQKQQTDKV